MRKEKFGNGERYHIFNSGTGKIDIFRDDDDRRRFLCYLEEHLYNRKHQRVVEVTAFALMPNHFHIALLQCIEAGVSYYLNKVCQSYALYFNAKYVRSGCLFSGRFQARHIDKDAYFLHITRYIHRNPLVLVGADGLPNYHWSSYPTYLGREKSEIVTDSSAMDMFASPAAYKDFVDMWKAGEDDLIADVLLD